MCSLACQIIARTLTHTGSSSPTSSVAPWLRNKQILNDTSMAVVELFNGDRRFFFQDLSGVIRQAFYSASNKQWRADINFVVALDAVRNFWLRILCISCFSSPRMFLVVVGKNQWTVQRSPHFASTNPKIMSRKTILLSPSSQLRTP